MKREPGPYPVVIQRIVDDCVAAARSHGIHSGGITVYVSERGSERQYVIALRIPAGETVPTRAMAPPRR